MRIRFLSLLLVLAFPVIGRAAEQRFRFERPSMATLFVITCYGEDEAQARAASDEAFAIAERIDAVASDYRPDSELMQLSTTPREVSPLLGELLAASLDMARRTGGAFDPTLGPVTRLWRESRKTRRLPDAAVLEEARARCGWQGLHYDPATRRTSLAREGMQLDLGGIAKGFTADRMMEIMVRHGFRRTCIAAGGDLRLGDPPPGREAWRVGLQTFDLARPEEVVELANCAVSTSGDLHQFVEIDGKRYSHVIDPATGLGLTRRLAVSVIAPSGTISDGLDNACCVAGAEAAEAFGLARGATRVVVRQ